MVKPTPSTPKIPSAHLHQDAGAQIVDDAEGARQRRPSRNGAKVDGLGPPHHRQQLLGRERLLALAHLVRLLGQRLELADSQFHRVKHSRAPSRPGPRCPGRIVRLVQPDGLPPGIELWPGRGQAREGLQAKRHPEAEVTGLNASVPGAECRLTRLARPRQELAVLPAVLGLPHLLGSRQFEARVTLGDPVEHLLRRRVPHLGPCPRLAVAPCLVEPDEPRRLDKVGGKLVNAALRRPLPRHRAPAPQLDRRAGHAAPVRQQAGGRLELAKLVGTESNNQFNRAIRGQSSQRGRQTKVGRLGDREVQGQVLAFIGQDHPPVHIPVLLHVPKDEAGRRHFHLGLDRIPQETERSLLPRLDRLNLQLDRQALHVTILAGRLAAKASRRRWFGHGTEGRYHFASGVRGQHPHGWRHGKVDGIRAGVDRGQHSPGFAAPVELPKVNRGDGATGAVAQLQRLRDDAGAERDRRRQGHVPPALHVQLHRPAQLARLARRALHPHLSHAARRDLKCSRSHPELGRRALLGSRAVLADDRVKNDPAGPLPSVPERQPATHRRAQDHLAKVHRRLAPDLRAWWPHQHRDAGRRAAPRSHPGSSARPIAPALPPPRSRCAPPAAAWASAAGRSGCAGPWWRRCAPQASARAARQARLTTARTAPESPPRTGRAPTCAAEQRLAGNRSSGLILGWTSHSSPRHTQKY
eukprot:scaffold22631_cov86-Isochrysis_galbana.AAC.3